jgi:hypothetical protein
VQWLNAAVVQALIVDAAFLKLKLPVCGRTTAPLPVAQGVVASVDTAAVCWAEVHTVVADIAVVIRVVNPVAIPVVTQVVTRVAAPAVDMAVYLAVVDTEDVAIDNSAGRRWLAMAIQVAVVNRVVSVTHRRTGVTVAAKMVAMAVAVVPTSCFLAGCSRDVLRSVATAAGISRKVLDLNMVMPGSKAAFRDVLADAGTRTISSPGNPLSSATKHSGEHWRIRLLKPFPKLNELNELNEI